MKGNAVEGLLRHAVGELVERHRHVLLRFLRVCIHYDSLDMERIDECSCGKDILEAVLHIAFRQVRKGRPEVEGVGGGCFEAVGQLHIEFLSPLFEFQFAICRGREIDLGRRVLEHVILIKFQ